MSENQHSTQSIAATAIALDWTFTGLAIVIVALRLYTRTRLIKGLGLEDLAISAGVVFSVAYSALIIRQVHYGLGRHFDTLTDGEKLGLLKPFYFSILFYQLTLSSAKISICTQYLRIVVTRGQRLVFSIMLGIIIVYSIWTALSAILLCTPPAHFWDSNVKGHCMNELRLWFTNAGLNIATDLALLILPIPILSKLKLPKRQKIILGCIMSLGAFVCLTSIVRLRSIYIISVSTDVSWTNVAAGYWSGIESNMAIICASLPTLRPLLSRYLPRVLGTSTHGRTSASGYANFSGARSQVETTIEGHPLGPLSDADLADNKTRYFRGIEDGRIKVVTVVEQETEPAWNRSDGASDRNLVSS